MTVYLVCDRDTHEPASVHHTLDGARAEVESAARFYGPAIGEWGHHDTRDDGPHWALKNPDSDLLVLEFEIRP